MRFTNNTIVTNYLLHSLVCFIKDLRNVMVVFGFMIGNFPPPTNPFHEDYDYSLLVIEKLVYTNYQIVLKIYKQGPVTIHKVINNNFTRYPCMCPMVENYYTTVPKRPVTMQTIAVRQNKIFTHVHCYVNNKQVIVATRLPEQTKNNKWTNILFLSP